MTSRADTGWRAGRLDRRHAPPVLMFGRMYEDAAVERAAFAPGSRVFCIASAGCTAFALAPDHAVTAVDISPVQIEYVRARLRGEAPRHGAAEAAMRVGRSMLVLAGWSPERVRAFAELEDPEEQPRFWLAHLDTRRFRGTVDMLLSRRVLRTVLPRDLVEAAPTDFGMRMRARLERCISRHPNRTNPYLRALVLGERPPRLDAFRAPRIELHVAEATAFLEAAAPASYDGFSLSNITDGASPALRARLYSAVQRAASDGAVVVLRSFSEAECRSEFDCTERDRSVLWGRVDVLPVAALTRPAETGSADP